MLSSGQTHFEINDDMNSGSQIAEAKYGYPTFCADWHIAGIKTFSGIGMKPGSLQSRLLVAITALWVPRPPDASLHEGLAWLAWNLCNQHVRGASIAPGP